MESAERAAIRRGLDALKPYLAAFVSQRSRAVMRERDNDTSALLRTIIDEWGTFQSHLP